MRDHLLVVLENHLEKELPNHFLNCDYWKVVSSDLFRHSRLRLEDRHICDEPAEGQACIAWAVG